MFLIVSTIFSDCCWWKFSSNERSLRWSYMQVNSSSCYFQFRHDRQEKSTDDSVLFLYIGPLNPKKRTTFIACTHWYLDKSSLINISFFDHNTWLNLISCKSAEKSGCVRIKIQAINTKVLRWHDTDTAVVIMILARECAQPHCAGETPMSVIQTNLHNDHV